MTRSTSTKRRNNNNGTKIGLRRSTRFTDKFNELPDELILTILSKFQYDIKTLLRCSSVCKHLNALVSKVDSLFLRFSYPGEEGDYLPCWNSHFHIPQLAIPGLLRVFANLKSVKIKLCLCPSMLPSDCHAFKLNAVKMNGKMKTQLCTGFEVGFLSRRGTADDVDDDALALKLRLHRIETERNPLMMSFFFVMLNYGPKTLSDVVIFSARMKQGSKSDEKVFLGSEQLAKLREPNHRVNESWLKNSENVIYWLNDRQQNEVGVGEKKVWVFQKWEFFGSSVTQSIIKETDVKDLMGAFDEDEDEVEGEDEGRKKRKRKPRMKTTAKFS